MKQQLVRFWDWNGLDYLIQVAILVVLLVGNAKVLDAKHTLENEGCEAYWSQYQSVNLSEVTLYNKTEAKYARAGRLNELYSDPGSVARDRSRLR